MRNPIAVRLSAAARKLYRKIADEWSISDAAGLLLLHTALEAWDELRQAQEIIQRDGPITKDRFGQDRLHPACQRAKESRAHMLAALKSLNLDLDSLNKPEE